MHGGSVTWLMLLLFHEFCSFMFVGLTFCDCLGGEFHTLSINVSGGSGGWFCVSMEARTSECCSDSRDCFCWWIVCLHTHWPHIKESRILCKCRNNSWAGEVNCRLKNLNMSCGWMDVLHTFLLMVKTKDQMLIKRKENAWLGWVGCVLFLFYSFLYLLFVVFFPVCFLWGCSKAFWILILLLFWVDGAHALLSYEFAPYLMFSGCLVWKWCLVVWSTHESS